MSVLYIDAVEITQYVKAVKQREQKKVVSTLLNGSEHVQLIGGGVTRLRLEVTVDRAGRDAIDNVDTSGGLVSVVDEGITYYGRIVEKWEWEKLANDIIQATIFVSVEVV